jgi:ABC-type uncharacterized transport system ATPase subunit
MKKVVLLVCVALLSVNGFSQKKKAASAGGGFAKIENLVAEVKNGNFQVTINENGKAKDAMIVKAVDGNFAPTNTKLSFYDVKGVRLYLLTWAEKVTTKTDLKTEEINTIYTIIYEIKAKKQVFSNTQITTNITEKVFLDKLKNASETQQRIRREGFEFTLNPDGTITQKSKKQENKWMYDADKAEYVAKK